MRIDCVPFAPGERYDLMWGCCAGTHASSTWQNNGNDYYAGAGTVCVAPIAGTVVRAGIPPLGQGYRVGIQGAEGAVYMAHMTGLTVAVGDKVKPGDKVGVVWDFSAYNGIPDHLHFSMCDGSYDGGRFVDPWSQVQALSLHVSGRTYEAPRNGLPTPNPGSPKAEPQYFVEDMPAKLGGGGPDVYGPWRRSALTEKNREERLRAMREKGLLAAPMDSARGDLYIYVYPKGRHGKPFRFGPWTSDDASAKAQKVLTGDGRITKPRRFAGKANSMYPWI